MRKLPAKQCGPYNYCANKKARDFLFDDTLDGLKKYSNPMPDDNDLYRKEMLHIYTGYAILELEWLHKRVEELEAELD